ncbi:MAG: T9SS type A sorting domain-containing protein [Ignavibacterium sp.]|nr:T9SS type A sorting domain-containing protein [Ignavibacterium sp.]
MKTIRTTVLFIIATFKIVSAQVDTTDWFPMQTGNYWEYMAWTGEGPKYFSIKVLGDTLMPNGKEYKIFYKEYFNITSDYTNYYRMETDCIYLYTGISSYFPAGEYKFLDFAVPDSTIWLIIPIFICCNPNSRGIASTFYDNTYYHFLQKSNEAKLFEDVYIDSTDTLWTPNDGSFPVSLNRGLGLVWHFIFNDGSYYLQGAIINGIKMGTIVAVENEDNTVPNNFSIKPYPNPFNSSTTLEINLPITGLTELSVYNTLGQKIATLIDEQKSTGNYNIQFNAAHLSSGVYFVLLKHNNLITKEKIILLK